MTPFAAVADDWVDVVLLSAYTFGCHATRHVVGGMLDRLSAAPIRQRLYNVSSWLNRAHMRWAWFSLFGVALTDLYIRMCAMGIWHDVRLF